MYKVDVAHYNIHYVCNIVHIIMSALYHLSIVYIYKALDAILMKLE